MAKTFLIKCELYIRIVAQGESFSAKTQYIVVSPFAKPELLTHRDVALNGDSGKCFLSSADSLYIQELLIQEDSLALLSIMSESNNEGCKGM